MMPLTAIAHSHVRSVVQPGDVVVDATVGNGHDTIFLAECVGPQGVVYGFDIQKSALITTWQRADAAGFTNIVLFQQSHADMKAAVPEVHAGKLRAVMFNLGYLPGGDKTVTTRTESTIAAIQQSLKFLTGGGIVTILAYVGHPGGEEEAAQVETLLNELPSEEFDVCEESGIHRISAPRLYVVRKRG